MSDQMDMAEVDAMRRRSDAEGIIREVHGYCWTKCPRRERCPGMACKQYQREMAAKDEIASLDDLDAMRDIPTGLGGIFLEPQIGR